jgi:hypothetical protein
MVNIHPLDNTRADEIAEQDEASALPAENTIALAKLGLSSSSRQNSSTSRRGRARGRLYFRPPSTPDAVNASLDDGTNPNGKNGTNNVHAPSTSTTSTMVTIPPLDNTRPEELAEKKRYAKEKVRRLPRKTQHLGIKPVPLMDIKFDELGTDSELARKFAQIKEGEKNEDAKEKVRPLSRNTEQVANQPLPIVNEKFSYPQSKTDGKLGQHPNPFAPLQRKPFKFAHFSDDNLRSNAKGKEQSQQKVQAKDVKGDKASSSKLSGNVRDLARTLDHHGSLKNSQARRPENKQLAKRQTYKGSRFTEEELRNPALAQVFESIIRAYFAANYNMPPPTFPLPHKWEYGSNVIAIYPDYFDHPINRYHDRRPEIEDPPIVLNYNPTKQKKINQPKKAPLPTKKKNFNQPKKQPLPTHSKNKAAPSQQDEDESSTEYYSTETDSESSDSSENDNIR